MCILNFELAVTQLNTTDINRVFYLGIFKYQNVFQKMYSIVSSIVRLNCARTYYQIP